MTNLADHVETLERALQIAVAELHETHPGYDPFRMKDASGRYLLLDAQAAVVNGHAALTRAAP